MTKPSNQSLHEASGLSSLVDMRLPTLVTLLSLVGCTGINVEPQLSPQELALAGALAAALESIEVEGESIRLLARDYHPPDLQKILPRVGEVVEWEELEIPEEYSFPPELLEVREVSLSESGNTAIVTILKGPIIAFPFHDHDCGNNYEIHLVKGEDGVWREEQTTVTVC